MAFYYKKGLNGCESHLVVVSSTDHGLMEARLINARLFLASTLLLGKVLPRTLERFKERELWHATVAGIWQELQGAGRMESVEVSGIAVSSTTAVTEYTVALFMRGFIAAKTQTCLLHWVGGYLTGYHTCHFNLPGYPFKTASS